MLAFASASRPSDRGQVAALSSDDQRQAEHKPDDPAPATDHSGQDEHHEPPTVNQDNGDRAQLLSLGQGGRRVSGEILDVCTPCGG